MLYQYSDFEIDTERFSVRLNGRVLDPEPKVIECIIYLIEHREILVSRDMIMNELWSGRLVSEASLTNLIKAARQLLGDDGKRQEVIKTIHGRGYRFVGNIDVQGSETITSSLSRGRNGSVSGIDRTIPYIAVLPFQNMGTNRQDDFLAEGISEELARSNHVASREREVVEAGWRL